MKPASTILIYFLVQFSFAQNIGLRSNIEFSDNKIINTTFGGGLYLNINDFSKNIELLLYTDLYPTKKQITQEMYTTYRHYCFGVSSLYKFKVSERSALKLGPSISYDLINASEVGIFGNWVQNNSKSIGLGIVGNFQFQQLFKLPLNFDVFITPSYLINFKNNTTLQGKKSDFLENLKIVTIQLGFSYRLN